MRCGAALMMSWFSEADPLISHDGDARHGELCGRLGTFLPVPDRSRVTGVALGGKDKDTLLAFCGNKIWKRKVQQHAMGAFTPWTKVGGTKLERTRAF